MFKKIKNSDAQYYIAAGVIAASVVSTVALVATSLKDEDN